MSREEDRKALRRIRREERKKHDPWFGRKRKTKFQDRKKEADRKACRRKDWDE